MKICFVSEGPDPSAELDCRFSRARYLVIFDTETRKHESIDRSQRPGENDESGVQSARHLVDRGCEWVICGHVGPQAMDVLKDAGLRVAVGASGVGWDAIEAFENDNLHEIHSADMPPETEKQGA